MLLVLHWYCSLYVLVLWILLVHWYERLYVSVQICYWYRSGTAIYMYWYCWDCWDCWYQPLYVFVPICYWYRTGTALYMYWYCGYCWYIGTSHSMSLCLYVTCTTLVLLSICTGTVGTVGTLVPATLWLRAYMLLVPDWYCSLYVLVLLIHWYQRLYVSVPVWLCVSVPVCLLCLCACCVCACCVSVPVWLFGCVAVGFPYPFVDPVRALLCMCTYYYYANEISLLSCK